MKPPYCKNPACVMYAEDHPSKRYYNHIRSHTTLHAGRVQRYKCKRFGKTFSDRSFDID